MKVSQYHYQGGKWSPQLPADNQSQLLLTFGERTLITNESFISGLKAAFPVAENIGCSSSGEILGDEVYDQTMVVTAITFEKTPIKIVSGNVDGYEGSFDAGQKLAQRLPEEDLSYVLVLSDGQLVNGTKLVAGISLALPQKVLVTGGLAGDGERFEETVVWHNEQSGSGNIALCGFYGDALKVGHGSLGGWSTFGPERVITRSEGNVLFELDGQPALDLYKSYLGEFSQQLPSSALRFPLSLQLEGEAESVVRTILGVDEKNKSMTFAGDMPENAVAKLMKSNFTGLIDGALAAAERSLESLLTHRAELALLISCVGRRLVLGQRVFEELEATGEVIGEEVPTCGFYSYGEISPLLECGSCRLHNQTMTITTFSEISDS